MADKIKVADIPDEMTVPLPKPIEHAGTTYSDITLREPTAGELIEIDKLSGRPADVFAVALLSGIPQEAVKKIPARPFLAAARYVVSLLGEDQPTGESD